MILLYWIIIKKKKKLESKEIIGLEKLNGHNGLWPTLLIFNSLHFTLLRMLC